MGSRQRRQPLRIFPAGPPHRTTASKVMAVALRPILPQNGALPCTRGCRTANTYAGFHDR